MDPITLQDLIDAAANAAEGQTPAQAVAARLTDAPAGTDVAALLDESITRFEELRAGGADTDDELSALEALADVADGVRVELGRLEQVATERADRIRALADRITPAEPEAPAEGDGAAEGGEGEGGEAAPTAETPAAPADPAPAVDSAPDAGADVAPVAEPVAASAEPAPARPSYRRVRLADLPRREVQPPQSTAPTGMVITAAAEVEGYAAGAPMSDLAAVARAGTSKFDHMPRYRPEGGAYIRAGIARIAIPFPDEVVSRSADDDERAIEAALDQSRLPGNSLIAAGGWCSPSETLWDLAPLLADANAGQVSIPEVQSPRGGLRWTEGPDYSTIWSGTGFIQTEAQAIAGSGFTTPIGGTVAGTVKPTFRVPCPAAWDEERAEAIGLSITGGILQNDSYSEVTEDVIAHSLIAHAHRVNARTIHRMVSEAGAATTINLGPSATPSLLNSIDAQIADIRYLNRMSDNATAEVMLPLWVKPVLRADQAVRTNSNTSEAYEVTDQKIDAWFKARNAVPQWVYDWQDAFTGVAGGFGSATPITSWPDTVNVLVYLAGTYLRSRGDVISLDAVHDSKNTHDNDVLHLFVEEKLLVIKRRYKPRLLTIALSANGATGIARELDSDGKIVLTP